MQLVEARLDMSFDDGGGEVVNLELMSDELHGYLWRLLFSYKVPRFAQINDA